MTGRLPPLERAIKAILGAICRIDGQEFLQVPMKGPLIVILNHINFLEVPLYQLYSLPRPAIGLVKRETWEQPLLGYLARRWRAIPVDRSGVDVSALRRAEAHLRNGGIVLLAPEGTRSRDGILRTAHGGLVSLALRSGAPVLPVANFGGEKVYRNLRRFRRTPFSFRVGEQFRFVNVTGAPRAEFRREATAEAMGRLAALLPPAYRGIYAEAARLAEEGEFRRTTGCRQVESPPTAGGRRRAEAPATPQQR